MTDQLSTLVSALLWSRLGAAELIVGVLVGLVFLAFAYPARVDGEAREEQAKPRADLAGHWRR